MKINRKTGCRISNLRRKRNNKLKSRRVIKRITKRNESVSRGRRGTKR